MEGIAAAAGVLFSVNVTAVIPATPANLGVFQAACAAVLHAGWHVSYGDGVAYGVILQAVEVATAVLMGGPALFPLVFTMAFGIVIGTYSSIYVALPVILLWGVRRDDEEAKPIKLQPARP